MVTFDFAALNFLLPEKNRYAYKLEGFDDDWRDLGRQASATFTNLSAGDYTLRVKASNNDGLWNATGRSLVIHVTPPWWEGPVVPRRAVAAAAGRVSSWATAATWRASRRAAGSWSAS